ncbi:MAG TPA: glycoside hydrolase family 3 N-terminal domain-containing protein [Gammaproteobacteria bacterium]|jgi:beta-N-acetylhexosaminidase|nr:glycoside hydrolase family 3 N-terminal domain-containing protein [Gammaproteobacteria bacterium]
MLLKEKIAQMLMIGFDGTTLHADDAVVRAILAQQLGGVILFDYNFQTKVYDRNIKNPQQLKQLNEQLQDYAKQAAIKNKKDFIPLFIGVDYEGGKVNRLKERYGFPMAPSAAEMGLCSAEQVKKFAEQMADVLSEAQINLNFAPALDVNVNPVSPVIGKLGRSYSADPKKVVECAAVFSKAYQQQGIIAAYKHFPGHGSAIGDTHHGFVDVTATWQAQELYPYQQLLPHANDMMVMVAHVVHHGLDSHGYPASLSAEIIQGLLRDQLHFNGVVVTDDMQMKAITDHYGLAEAMRLAINAGVDLLVFGNQLVLTPQDPGEMIELIYQEVMRGLIAESRIEEAWQRIKKLKEKIRKKCVHVSHFENN